MLYYSVWFYFKRILATNLKYGYIFNKLRYVFSSTLVLLDLYIYTRQTDRYFIDKKKSSQIYLISSWSQTYLNAIKNGQLFRGRLSVHQIIQSIFMSIFYKYITFCHIDLEIVLAIYSFKWMKNRKNNIAGFRLKMFLEHHKEYNMNHIPQNP